MICRILMLTLCAIYSISNALQVDLEPGDMRCIGQELDPEDAALFTFGAVAIGDDTLAKQKVTVVVTDPEEGTIIDEKIVIGGNRKSHQKNIELRGIHQMCFELEGGRTPVRVTFHVEFKARSSLESARTVAKGDLPSLEVELKAVEDSIQDISKEIDFARRQENILWEAGAKTASRVEWFGTLSIGILGATSLWQLVYLRYFFASKKLL